MKINAIISEFNHFQKGNKSMIDKAREIADRLGIDNIERDTTPQIFNPEEVIYEE